jgi:hypothetical protein
LAEISKIFFSETTGKIDYDIVGMFIGWFCICFEFLVPIEQTR